MSGVRSRVAVIVSDSSYRRSTKFARMSCPFGYDDELFGKSVFRSSFR